VVEVGHAGGGHHLIELQRDDRAQRRQHKGRAGIRQEEEGGEQDAGNGKPAEEPVLDAGQVHEGAP